MDNKYLNYFVLFLILLLFSFSIIYFCFFSAPAGFPTGTVIHLEQGKNVNDILELLNEKKVIKNNNLAKILLYLTGDNNIPAGYYYFPQKISLFKVINKLQTGDYGQDMKRVTFPEGLNTRQMVNILEENLPDFPVAEFRTLAEPLEGYLFPDTYFFFPQMTPAEIIMIMNNNFKRQTGELQEEARSKGRDWHQVITIASLIELEASDKQARRMISDIIWRRLNINMPLQIDAVFPYIMGKNTFEVSLDDLQYDSPYNTYRYRGLPPGPIANPSLDSLEAALRPTENNYIYYLSDKEGNMHYTIDHDAHVRNKFKYLK